MRFLGFSEFLVFSGTGGVPKFYSRTDPIHLAIWTNTFGAEIRHTHLSVFQCYKSESKLSSIECDLLEVEVLVDLGKLGLESSVGLNVEVLSLSKKPGTLGSEQRAGLLLLEDMERNDDEGEKEYEAHLLEALQAG